MNRIPFTVVGVAPPGFTGEVVGRMTDLWMPVTMRRPEQSRLAQNAHTELAAVHRAPDANVTLAQVQSAYPTLVRQTVIATAPGADGVTEARKAQVEVESGERGISGLRAIYAEPLNTLMAAVALVLLVVCANVANLLLARGAARSRELGVRMALGAGRVRLVRQLLTENLILAALGGALGLVLASWGSKVLLRIADGGPGSVPLDTRLDVRVLAFTALVTGLTALLFGLIPALRATRVELAATLRAHSRGMTGGLLGGPGRLGVGKLLVVFQVALSLTLLVGTSMLVRSTRALANVDAGLARDRLLIVTVDAAPTGLDNERLAQLSRELLERVRRIPGVAQASFSENGIFSGPSRSRICTSRALPLAPKPTPTRTTIGSAPGTSRRSARVSSRARHRRVGQRHAPPVTVINQTMASFYFPKGQAVGHRVKVDSTTYEIVGVVADTRDHELRQAPARRLYLPVYQTGGMPTEFTYELLATGDPASSSPRLAASCRRRIARSSCSTTTRSRRSCASPSARTCSSRRWRASSACWRSPWPR